jgi:phospholipid/cholesterol/gamma-HCH transport system substrate-binding protein
VVNKLSGIIDQVQVGKGTIGKLFVDESLYNHLNGISTQIEQLTIDLHTILNSSDNSIGKLAHDNGEIYGDFHGLATQLSGVITEVNKVVDGINSGKGTLGQLAQNPAAYDDTRQILADVHQLLAGIQAGQGTAGKFLKTDEFGDQIKATMGRVDTLLDKMNNGKGTVARLLNDSALVDDLDSVTRETQGLMKDFRANPKKFLRIELKLF